MALRLCFANFWPGAFTEANGAYFLPYVFDLAFDGVEITDDIHTAEIVVSSVFGKTPVPRTRAIQFLGENQRPNLALHRYSLSFDYDTFGGRNFRLPLWWWRLDWPGFADHWRRRPSPTNERSHGHEELIPIDALMRPRSFSQSEQRRFCVLIASNPEPLRINLFLALRSLGEVVGYGRLFNSPLGRSKYAVLHQFRFCLCPENGVYPGYHTEKLVDAWFGGCVLLYSGDRLLSSEFNPLALINYQDFLDTARFCDAVSSLETHADAFEKIYSQPLLARRPTLAPLIEFLQSAVAEIRRRPSV